MNVADAASQGDLSKVQEQFDDLQILHNAAEVMRPLFYQN